ncbi:hypothetical protein AVEN_128358-1 [Araneus ventricosus]|uniref:Uncharacterized protein n=1 Tax=Araneus ventricosus TaxID=182803 RepID=A0A4Y2DDZ2_ARAVE|nr:hypothetical protein AVEN_128358-1 [Araneus ventricosus]
MSFSKSILEIPSSICHTDHVLTSGLVGKGMEWLEKMNRRENVICSISACALIQQYSKLMNELIELLKQRIVAVVELPAGDFLLYHQEKYKHGPFTPEYPPDNLPPIL